MDTNLDQQSVDHFGAQAHVWWDRDGRMKTLHDINPARLSFIERYQPLSGVRVLDIGCGGGILSQAMAEAGAQVTGIDLSPEVIEVARAHAASQHTQIDYQCVSAQAFIQLQPASFDLVTCMELLEHIPDPQAMITTAAKALKPNGWLCVSTLNHTLKAKVLAVWVAEYVLHLLPKGTHNPDQFIAPHQLAYWGRGAGLTLKAQAGLSYNPITRIAQLTHSADINYLMAFQKPSTD